MLIDTHAHLTDEKFSGDLGEVLSRAAAGGVEAVIDVGDSLVSSRRCLEHAREYDGIYAAVGIHPNNSEKAADGDLEKLEELADDPAAVAIGETGLDFYRPYARREIQELYLRRSLSLAADKGLPAIIHCRDAYSRLIPMLREMKAALPGAVLHCFSGVMPDAEALIELGFYLSFGGPLTYPGNAKLRGIAAAVPAERILLETDCPYLPPQRMRGGRNEPAYVGMVAQNLAALRETSVEEIGRITSANARRLFERMR